MSIVYERLQSLPDNDDNKEKILRLRRIQDKISQTALFRLVRPDIPALGDVPRAEAAVQLLDSFTPDELLSYAPDIFDTDIVQGIGELVDMEVAEALPDAARRAVERDIPVRVPVKGPDNTDTGEIDVIPLPEYAKIEPLPPEVVSAIETASRPGPKPQPAEPKGEQPLDPGALSAR